MNLIQSLEYKKAMMYNDWISFAFIDTGIFTVSGVIDSLSLETEPEMYCGKDVMRMAMKIFPSVL